MPIYPILLVALFCVGAACGTPYYVNDQYTNGDVYTSTAGNDGYNGLTPATPKFTITNLLATYTLAAGDIVYIDTGIYSNYTVYFTGSGASGNPITFQGSTNATAGGSILERNSSSADGFVLTPRHLLIQDITIRRCRRGVLYVGIGTGNTLRRIKASENIDAIFVGTYMDVDIDQALAFNNSGIAYVHYTSGAKFNRVVSWSNAAAFSKLPAGSWISNSVIVGGLVFSNSAIAAGDHNIIWNAQLSPTMAKLSDIQNTENSWFYSTVVEPQFANPAMGDFHPKSEAGRWDWGITNWSTDTVHSALIDFGNPGAPYTNEQEPNGSLVNVGYYGNTTEASKSRTNAWLFALSFNDGGSLVASGGLYWTSGNFSNGATLTIQYSVNNGSTWNTIATNIPVANRYFQWNANSVTSAPMAYWRIQGESPRYTNTWDTNDYFFSIHGTGCVSYYVNDLATNGDVYCSAPGQITNSGLSAHLPKASLQNLLDTYDLVGGDVVYIDTGVYTAQTTSIQYNDGGFPGAPVQYVGSTNWNLGGSVFLTLSTAYDILEINQADHVRLANFTLRGGRNGLRCLLADNIVVERVTARNNNTGIRDADGVSNRFQNCMVVSNTTGYAGSSIRTAWDLGVSWSNTIAFSLSGVNALSVSNSVLVGGTAFSGSYPFAGDYNAFWATTLGLSSLYEYQKVRDGWWYCSYMDPQFADPANLDFHPRSLQGRWNQAVTNWVVDIVHSGLIDFGSPLNVFTNEVSPNGSNVNAGAYGNTAEASKSRTNAWLQALSLCDGGTLNAGTNSTDRVFWRYGQFAAEATVRVELSKDAGKTWTIVATNLSVAVGFYAWTNTDYGGSSRSARWRVVSESDTNVLDATTRTNFTFRSGPYTYFVNDAFTSNDVYCTEPGQESNSGESAGSPKPSLLSVVTNFDLEAGDIVYIDTGNYGFLADQSIGYLDAGTSNDYVYLRGSTNKLSGGTVFTRIGSGVGLNFSGADYMDIADITITNCATGLRLANSSACRLSRVWVRKCSTGYNLQSATNTMMTGCSAERCMANGISLNAGSVFFRNGVLWSNKASGIQVVAGQFYPTNSVIAAFGMGAACYYVNGTEGVQGNYNDVFAGSDAVMGYDSASKQTYSTLSSWRAGFGCEISSLETDPQFADPDKSDFHLKTETFQGRFVTGYGWYPGFDSLTSELIDSGDPASVYSNEPSPNGSRIDIGLYGNSSEASKGRTNAWLYAGSLRSGGWVRGTSTLHWVAGGTATGHTVRVEFSPDGGNNWTLFTSGIPARTERFMWDTLVTNGTAAGLWRVSSLVDSSLTDGGTNFFGVRNDILRLFINDKGTNGDVYTSGPGSATNWLASANLPLNSLALAFQKFDVEPGDRFYVDTGIYTTTENTVIGFFDKGGTNAPVMIQGSTNESAGGTVLYRLNPAPLSCQLELTQTEYISVSNLVMRNALTGLRIEGSSFIQMSDLVVDHNTSNGVVVSASTNVAFRRLVSAQNRGHGLVANAAVGLECLNSVVWSNDLNALWQSGGDLRLTNNVIHAYKDGSYLMTLVSNPVIRSDYNVLRVENPATVAWQNGLIHKQIIRWQEATTNDLHSLSSDPEFADATARDFHLRSQAGRFSPAVTNFITTDTNFSLLIDSGDPAGSYAKEPSPNGNRVNIGLYGDTSQASLSNTNGWLLALTLNDGGSIRGTNSYLYWIAGGIATGHLVYVDVSLNGGTTWTNIATNIAAATGCVFWNTSLNGSTPSAVWRVVSQASGSIRDQTDNTFILNNGPIAYYVNDNSKTGDVYTLAVGSSANDGLSVNTPADSVETIQTRYDLRPGDRVMIDTGVYSPAGSIVLGDGVFGVSTNYIRITGSTNESHGGSLFNFAHHGHGLTIQNTAYIRVEHIGIQRAGYGLRIFNSTNCELEFVRIRDCGTGFSADSATETRFVHCVAMGCATNGLAVLSSPGTMWEGGVLWSNRVGVLAGVSALEGAYQTNGLTFHNSVVGALTPGGYAYAWQSGVWSSEYNCVYVTNGAYAAYRPSVLFNVIYDTLSSWRRETTNDLWSMNRNPEFIDAGAGDFHPSSQGGHYDIASKTFVMDATTSALVDAGDPSSTWTNEAAPHGYRINIGLYGNTTQASMAPPNGVLTAVGYEDGGFVTGTGTLRWVARGASTGHAVRISASYNKGVLWSNVATGLSAASQTYSWDCSFTNALSVLWKIQDETMPSIESSTYREFAIRNQAFTFFVNDPYTNGDVYCFKPGNSTNSGTTPFAPKLIIQEILSSYDLEPGDVVYVDTGAYTNQQPVSITQFDSAIQSNQARVVFVGSTNTSAGGSLLVRTSTGAVIQVDQACGVDLINFRIRGNAVGCEMQRSIGCSARWVHIDGGVVGFSLDWVLNGVFRHCTARGATQYGLRSAASCDTSWQQGVLWTNRMGIGLLTSTNYLPSLRNYVHCSNSVMGVSGAGNVAFRLDRGLLASDYNSIFLTNGAVVAEGYPNISRWTHDTQRDRFSLCKDPWFADANGGDYHVKSQRGRYNETSQTFVTDNLTSPLIDAGNPSEPFSEEPAPNGNWLNVGLYANTPWASMTPTNASLSVISLDDGGRIEGTNYLYWVARGNATGGTVRISYSGDGGRTWTNLITNVAASAGAYLWDTTQHPSTILAYWRVILEQDPVVQDQNKELFAVRNGPLSFFVNDVETNGDVYCTAPGAATNLGVLAYMPMDKVQRILDTWDVEPGDIIYIDTGMYADNPSFTVGLYDSGSTNENGGPVHIQGSTNRAFGGSVLNCMGQSVGIRVDAGWVVVRHLKIGDAATGVMLNSVDEAEFEWVDVQGGNSGFSVNDCRKVQFGHCSAARCSSEGLSLLASRDVQWDHGVLWSNQVGILINGGSISLQNSVLCEFGTNSYAFHSTESSTISSDYNCFQFQDGAKAVYRLVNSPYPEICFSLSQWVRDAKQDSHSIAGAPLFVSPATGDFHLMSQGGRYVTTSGLFMVDTQTSPLLDAGNPSSAYTNESLPNGYRINIGQYGNTKQASRTPTNGWLQVVSCNDGGVLNGAWSLVWTAGGAATGHVARLDYSSDGGTVWVPIATSVLVQAGAWPWDTRTYMSSALGKWRIWSLTDTNLVDETDHFFTLHNQPLNYYVNNDETNGDVYTHAIGHAENTGISPDSPKSSVQMILDTYDLEPGDVIYLDTGSYLMTNTIEWTRFDAWEVMTNLPGLEQSLATNRVSLQGSTNAMAGGSRLIRYGEGVGVNLNVAPGVAIRHINLTKGTTGLYANNSAYSMAEWVVADENTDGYSLKESDYFGFRHCVARNNLRDGLVTFMSDGISWAHGVLWANQRCAVYQDGTPLKNGSLNIANSVVGAFQQGAFSYFIGASINRTHSWTSDFNNIYRTNGAFTAGQLNTMGLTNRQVTVNDWMKLNGQDTHSLTIDPGFADVVQGDYHLKTTRYQGRYDPILNAWTNNNEYSRLIDAGDPDSTFDREPQPNGGRVDMGLYGDTEYASKTPTNGWLTCITLNDGGSVEGTVPLYWVLGGVATGHLVNIDYSPLAGLEYANFTWTNVVANYNSSLGPFPWNSKLYGRSWAGVWRIRSAVDTNVSDVVDQYFVVRGDGGAIPYFVNDSSTQGDVYCTAPGVATNLGILPSMPANSIQLILNNYSLAAPDIIYVDTGHFDLYGDIVMNDLDSGRGTNYVTIQGSTNFAMNGSVLDHQGVAGSVLQLMEANAIILRYLTLQSGTLGLDIQKTTNCLLEDVLSKENAQSGFSLSQESKGIAMSRCVARLNGEDGLRLSESEVTFNGGILWDNGTAVSINDSDATFQNSVLQASGTDKRIFLLDNQSSVWEIESDYNDMILTDAARLAIKDNTDGGRDIYATLIDWQRLTGKDAHSLSHDPAFAGANEGDFRLKSSSGRFLPDGTLTNDSVTSPLIDTGNPTSPFINERVPNGSNINIGANGNTYYASLSPTNAPWLLCISINAGGTVGGTTMLFWASGGLTNESTVRLEFSRNSGIEWDVIATNILNTRMGFMWDISQEMPILSCKWKVVCESQTNVSDECDATFVIKNSTLNLFVNDMSTNGDVYCTAIGSPANDGLTNSAPLDDPARVFQYPLTAGDRVYIDTGYYEITNDMVLGELNQGLPGLVIRVQGSTNDQAGGTLIDRGGHGNGLRITNTRHIEVDHIKIRNADIGLSASDSLYCDFRWIECVSNVNYGISVMDVTPCAFAHCVARHNKGWGCFVGSGSSVTWSNGVLWGNELGCFNVSANLAVNNAILQTTQTNSLLYSFVAGGKYFDRNIYLLGPRSYYGYDRDYGLRLRTLQEWQRYTGADVRSVVVDPLCANPAAGDFHLQSEVGRFVTSNGVFVLGDSNTSWAIDAGNPTDPYSFEPAPNGNRLNAGLYGNTTQASKSLTNSTSKALLVASLSDGGLMSGSNLLYWLSRGMSPTDLVQLAFSADDGRTWTSIVSGVSAICDGYNWNASSITSTPLALWKVVYSADTNIFDRTDKPFVLRNGPIAYYVNDGSTTGDVYTFSPGSSTNLGFSPYQPLSQIREIVEQYDLEGGDKVFVDTGFYRLSNNITVNALKSGTSSNLVQFIGSTNYVWGGTILSGAQTSFVGSIGFDFNASQWLLLSDFIISNVECGLNFGADSADVIVSNVFIKDGGVGVRLYQSDRNIFRHVVMTRMTDPAFQSVQSVGNSFENGIIWSTRSHAVSLMLGALSISNSILFAAGDNVVCYNMLTNSSLRSDFNCLYVTNNAAFGLVNGVAVEGLPQWVTATTQDMFSLAFSPNFADAAKDDFHLKSSSGRYLPATGSYITTDAVSSLLIDAGGLNSAFALEPEPNGRRVNIGRYGNTVQASMSRTNAWVLAVTASSGGRAGGIFYLVWNWGAMDSTNKVALDYSYDNGMTWLNIVTSRVDNYKYLWWSDQQSIDGDKWPKSPIARWKITVVGQTNVYDVVDNRFILNGPFTFFVNDAFTNRDIYTSAVGSDTNLGIKAGAPKATLKNLLDTFDLDAQDKVLIDTGVYPFTTNEYAIVAPTDSGDENGFVCILGNTNELLSIFDRSSWGPPATILSVDANYMDVEHLMFLGGNLSVGGQETRIESLAFSNASMTLNGFGKMVSGIAVDDGDVSINSTNTTAAQISVRDGSIRIFGANVTLQNSGISGTANPALRIGGYPVTVRNNSFAGSGTQISIAGGYVTLENNIVVADGTNRFCIYLEGGLISSDYNNLIARNGAWIGNKDGFWEKLLYWQRASGQDAHSLSHDPFFVNEAAGDLHLKSTTARWTPTGWVTDTVHSVCIDSGNPASIYTNEWQPNGSRVNMGQYGNSSQASMSTTNAWVLALTMNDGGVLKGTNTIRWTSGGMASTNCVRLEYSYNNGTNWQVIAGGISWSNSEYEWDTTTVASSLAARWRVVLESNTNVADQVDQPFAVRNVPLAFYVNDNSQVGDVYTHAIGATSNDGLTTNTPKNTLQGILDAYDLESLDTVYVDTGVYPLSSDIRIIWSRGGDDQGNVLFRGSTNYLFGGSRISRGNLGAGNGFNVMASRITLRDFLVNSAYQGVYFNSNRFCIAERILAFSNAYGVVNEYTIGATNRNMRLWRNQQSGVYLVGTRTTVVENCTFVGNSNFALTVGGSSVDRFQNNIFYEDVSNSIAYGGSSNSLRNAFIDYNAYYFPDTGSYHSIYGSYVDLKNWQLTEGHDFRSAITNPLFANVEEGDFHVKSMRGRWVDGYGWTNDSESSWAIDMGSPYSVYTNEPATNGNRINIGAYGNTEQASKGTTNVFIEVRALNDTMYIGETNYIWPLIWSAHNLPAPELVQVQFSGDQGASWYTLSNNASAYQEYIIWPTTPYFNTIKGGRWRVVSTTATNYVDENNAPFYIFYGEFAISRVFRDPILNGIVWRGAWDEHYVVEYSTNCVEWFTAPSGSGENQSNDYVTTRGGDFTYIDVESAVHPWRNYRVRRVVGEITVEIYYITRVSSLMTVVWRCTEPSTFTVQCSTNIDNWVTAPTGLLTNQQPIFTTTSAGDFSYQDVQTTNVQRRAYRILRQ